MYDPTNNHRKTTQCCSVKKSGR